MFGQMQYTIVLRNGTLSTPLNTCVYYIVIPATKVEWVPVNNDLIHHFQYHLIELISKHDYFDGDLDVETFERKYCRKNPGHEKFIPIGKFQMKHLPANVQDPLVYEFIKATADLTLRINVKKKKGLMTGSGLIYEIEKYVAGVTSNRSITLCPCHSCQSFNKPSNTWFRVKIITSAHLIRDGTEAFKVSSKVFYDRPDSLDFQLRMSNIHEVNVEKDISFLECVSCDKDMLDRAMTSLQHFDDLRYKVYNKYKRYKDVYKMVFIVSHPHGNSKCVSIGEWVNKIVVDGDSSWAAFEYTTCTCPGSGGAYVHILGYSGRVWHYPHVHSGFSVFSKDFNHSSCGFIIK